MQQRIIKANNYPLFICISLKELALFKLISDSCNIENCDQVFSQPCMYIRAAGVQTHIWDSPASEGMGLSQVMAWGWLSVIGPTRKSSVSIQIRRCIPIWRPET